MIYADASVFAQTAQDPAVLCLKDLVMQCYKISAEHIKRSAARSVLAYANAQGIAVMHCGPDDVFTDLFHCVVEGKRNANKIRDRFWEHNGGVYCAVVAWNEEDDEDASWQEEDDEDASWNEEDDEDASWL